MQEHRISVECRRAKKTPSEGPRLCVDPHLHSLANYHNNDRTNRTQGKSQLPCHQEGSFDRCPAPKCQKTYPKTFLIRASFGRSNNLTVLIGIILYYGRVGALSGHPTETLWVSFLRLQNWYELLVPTPTAAYAQSEHVALIMSIGYRARLENQKDCDHDRTGAW